MRKPIKFYESHKISSDKGFIKSYNFTAPPIKFSLPYLGNGAVCFDLSSIYCLNFPFFSPVPKFLVLHE